MGRGAEERRPLRVAVASDQRLMAHAVAVALTSRGYETAVVSRPGVPAPRAPEVPRLTAAACDVGLMLGELGRPDRLEQAVDLLSTLSLPWIVLMPDAASRASDILRAAGAARVLPDSVGLDTIEAELRDAGGRPPGHSPVGHRHGLGSGRAGA